jgi:6-phosphogluconolactonase (cycloisomerase 2 family)
MKMGKYALLLLAGLPFLEGCKGFWNPPASSGGGTTTTTLSSGNFYILNQGSTSSSIYGFKIASGTLTALSGSPYAVNGGALDIAVNSSGTFLYVSSSAGVYVYTISSSGALTIGEQVSQDSVATSIAVDPAGLWMIEALSTGEIDAFPINSSTGALDTGTRTQTPVALAGAAVHQMAIAPNGSFIVVTEGAAGTQVFPFTSSATKDPIGSPLSPTLAPYGGTGASAVSVAVDPQNRLFYVGEIDAFTTTGSSGGLRAFAVTTGPLAVTSISSTPYVSGGTSPTAIAPSSTGDYVYVASWQGTSAGMITPFQVTSSGTNSSPTYTLTAQTNTAATGVEPSGLIEDSDGYFLLAVSPGGSPTFSGFIFDTTTAGKLDLTNKDSTASNPIAIVAQ